MCAASYSQFATEAVSGFRTVISLIMEDMINDRYDVLLKGHVKEAFSSAKFGTLIFAASDSIELACMALAFWYGGTLMAKREYGLVQFLIVYMGTAVCHLCLLYRPDDQPISTKAPRLAVRSILRYRCIHEAGGVPKAITLLRVMYNFARNCVSPSATSGDDLDAKTQWLKVIVDKVKRLREAGSNDQSGFVSTLVRSKIASRGYEVTGAIFGVSVQRFDAT